MNEPPLLPADGLRSPDMPLLPAETPPLAAPSVGSDLPPLAMETPPPVEMTRVATELPAVAIVAPPPLVEPPLLPPVRPVLPAPSVWPKRLAMITGAVQLVLCVWVSNWVPHPNISRQIGFVTGVSALWPLIILGLFSIFKRFRNQQSRSTILTVIWSFFILSDLGNALRYMPRAPLRPSELSPAVPLKRNLPAPESLKTSSSATPPVPRPKLLTDASVADDFSPGSDERLIKLSDHAVEDRYHEIEAAYRRAVVARPHDAVLALERVRFIEHFAYAEDLSVDSASADCELAVTSLKTNFPEAPGTVLYELRGLYGEEFEARARDAMRLVPAWPPADRAQFFLMRARAANVKGGVSRVKAFANLAFTNKPTAEAALLLADATQAEGDTRDALRVLAFPVFKAAEPEWERQQMDRFFEWKRPDLALPVYDELKLRAPNLVKNAALALRLAEAGRVEAGREIFRKLPANQWDHLSRFQFELEYGTAGQARDAYRTLRGGGVRYDPLFKHRLELFWKYPGLGWNLFDVLGAVLLLFLFAGAAALPLLLLIPIHYWSMWRAQRGKVGGWSGAGWGLRAAWFAMGSFLVANTLALWIFQPEVLQAAMNQVGRGQVFLSDNARLEEQALCWAGWGVGLSILLARFHAWKLFSRGHWTVGKSLGWALGATFGLRGLLIVCALIWPGILFDDLASVSPATTKFVVVLLQKFGPLGLIAVVAGLVPVLEETFFRGVLLQAFARHIPIGWANATQALLFAMAHESVRLLPFFFLFGITAGLFARRSGGLFASIVLHASNNLLACLGVLALNRLHGL